jgi:signal transduction histidine kinase
MHSDKEHADYAIDPLTLRFVSRQTEAHYRRNAFQRDLPYIRIGLLAGLIVHCVYFYIDTLVIDDYTDMWLIRLIVLMPPILIGYLISYAPNFGSYHLPDTVTLITLNGLGMIFGATWFGNETLMYFTPGLVMVIMFAFFLLGQPYVVAAVNASLLVALHMIVMIMDKVSTAQFANAAEAELVSCAILTVAAYNYERASRSAFASARQLRDREMQAREKELSRLQWLENATGFLRHEMRNSVVGVKTSLELLHKKAALEKDNAYLARARQGVQHIGELLETIGNATSLEAAFAQEVRQRFKPDELLREHIESYKVIYPQQRFSVEIDDSPCVIEAVEERLIQVLDNLVSNAVDHCDKDTPIIIRAGPGDGHYVMHVINQGQALPEDKLAIFDLFTSFRKDNRAETNRGIGLYIVRLIVEGLGGSVEARDRWDSRGAEFTVSLPLAQPG